jgi:bifunctional DNA-binding transcriptional regulator/antitoxin component of YhaV-PrlF toxin-antitoxin module
MPTFHTELLLQGKSATGFAVPDEVVESFGAGKRVAVVVTIGGYSYRSTVGPYRGANMVPVSGENRSAAGIAAGDIVEVTLDRDDQPREVEVPADLAAALDADAAIRGAFDALSVSNRRAHVQSVEGAKTAETRDRRIAKVVGTLAS